MASKKDYESQSTISKISATSRASVKVGDSYYTVEYSEERLIKDLPEMDIMKERSLLWETVNAECDAQIEDILKMLKK